MSQLDQGIALGHRQRHAIFHLCLLKGEVPDDMRTQDCYAGLPGGTSRGSSLIRRAAEHRSSSFPEARLLSNPESAPRSLRPRQPPGPPVIGLSLCHDAVMFLRR